MGRKRERQRQFPLGGVERLYRLCRGDLRNQRELQDQLGETVWERLAAWGEVDPDSVQTQADLVGLWTIKQPSVSQTLQQLIDAGAVEALPRRGRTPFNTCSPARHVWRCRQAVRQPTLPSARSH